MSWVSPFSILVHSKGLDFSHRQCWGVVVLSQSETGRLTDRQSRRHSAGGKKSGVRGHREVRMADLSTGQTVQWCWLNVGQTLEVVLTLRFSWPVPSAHHRRDQQDSSQWPDARPNTVGVLGHWYPQDPQWQNMLTYQHHLMKHVFWIPGECLVLPCQSTSSLQEVSQLSQLQHSCELNTEFHPCGHDGGRRRPM